MRKAIVMVSRVRKWQIKQSSNGRCPICGKESAPYFLCDEHRKKNRERYAKKAKEKKQNRVNCISCNGTGKVEFEKELYPCVECHGTGYPIKERAK